MNHEKLSRIIEEATDRVVAGNYTEMDDALVYLSGRHNSLCASSKIALESLKSAEKLNADVMVKYESAVAQLQDTNDLLDEWTKTHNRLSEMVKERSERVADLEHRLSVYDSSCATDGIEGRDAVIADLRRQLAARQEGGAP